MGATNSKNPHIKKSNSVRQSKRAKKDSLAKIDTDVARIKGDIENTQEVNVELLRSQLLLNAGKVQELRGAEKNRKKDATFLGTLNAINACIIQLEEKEKERDEGRESKLDLGAVESHSFISQDVTKVLERREREEDRIRSLGQMSTRIGELDVEIRSAVAKDDIRSLIIVEKKLHLLYDDLEQYNPRPMTSDFQEKERLAANLIKYNKKINNVKRKSGVVGDGSDGPVFSKQPAARGGVLEVLQIVDELSDLEVSAFTFENVRSSPDYEHLEMKLKKHYTTLENTSVNSDDERKRVVTAKNHIKKILSSLKQKAAENEALLTRQLAQIDEVVKELSDYKAQAERLQSSDTNASFQLDQKIRTAWDKLNLVNTNFPQLQRKKDTTIIEIQDLLQRMNDRANDHQRLEIRRQQLKDFQTTYINLKRSETIRNDEVSRAMLEKMEVSLRNFLSHKSPEAARHKKYSVSSEIMDQLVTEMTNEKMFKAGGVEDLSRIQDARITPAVDPGAEAMERIKQIEDNINDIRTSIRSFKGTSDSDMYDNIEEQLLAHKNQLESIDTANRLVSNAKERALKRIEETNVTLRNRTEVNEVQVENQRRSSGANQNRKSVKSVNATLQTIMLIDSSVHAIERKVRKFRGNARDKEYAVLVEELHLNDQALRGTEVGAHESLLGSKRDVLDHINRLQTELALKASENENGEQDELGKIKEVLGELKRVKKGIDCFSGAYKNTQYTQLETDLKNNLDKTLGVKEVSAKIARARNQTRETIEKYLRVLEERSVKPHVVKPMASLERAGVNLLDIKNRMEYFAGSKHDDQYFQIVRDLHACNDEIKTLTDEGEAGARKAEYLQYIDDLFNYFDAKMNYTFQPQADSSQLNTTQEDLQEVDANVNDIQVREVLQKFELYRQEADDVQKQIDAYTPNSPASHYHALDQKLIDLMVNVDKLHVYNVPDVTKQRKQILQKLHASSEILDEKCRPMIDTLAAPDRQKILAEIDAIMNEVDALNENIRRFHGGKHDRHYVDLDEALIRLFLKLDSVNPSSDAVAKNSKLKALKVVKMNMKLLEEKVRLFEEELYEGETLV